MSVPKDCQSSRRWSTEDKFADDWQSTFGRVGDDGVAAFGKAFEANKMLRQRGCDVELTFDRCHRIFFAAHDKGRAPNTREVRDHVERVIFATGPCEPLQNLGTDDNSA